MKPMPPKTYYKTCPDCGANLDPDEHCDCHKEAQMPEAS